MASLDELTGLINVIQGVKGTKSKRTTQTQLSDDSVQQLVGDILAGPGGVADIGSSARASGLYDSTTEDLMLGDLYSRAAVRAETARAPTVETMETPGAGLGDIGTVLAGAQVLRSVMGSGGGGAAAAGGAGLAQRATDALFGGQAAAPIASSVGQAGIGAGGAIASSVPDAASIVGTDLISGGASAAGSTAGGTAVGGLASRAGGFVGANAVPLGGSLLSGLLGGKDAAKDPKNVALTAAMGAMTMGPVGLVAAPIAALVGGLLKDGGLGIGSELKRTGRKVEKEVKRVGRKIGKIFGW